MASSKPRKKASIHTKYCVACGVCVNTCPLQAININTEVYAEVNPNICVGCNKCANACPASTITMQ